MSWKEKVHPELRRRVEILLANLLALNLDVRVVQSLRTFAEQDELFKKRPKVTNARGGQSNHNYGLAVDLCPFTDGKPDWNNTAAFNLIGREAKKLSLEWGGDWKFVDKPHVQLRGLSIKECYALFNRGGLEAVWSRMYQILGGAKPTKQTPTADDLLEFGDTGAEVTKLQKQLVNLKLLQPHEVDGDFGIITKRAVIAFQRINGLTADGIVGKGTRSKLMLDLRDEEINLEIPAVNSATSSAPQVLKSERTEQFTPPEQNQENVATKSETILQTFEKYGDTVQKTTEKITNIQNSVSPISKASWFMTLTAKVTGFALLIYGWAKDNWFELLIAFGLIALAVFVYSKAKDRAVAKTLKGA